MAVGDLEALFETVDGLKEDLMEYGTIAAAAIGANVAFNYGVDFVLSKWTTAPDWARKYGVPTAAILAGVFGSRLVSRYNRKAATGVAIGLVAAGLSAFAKGFLPNVKGLGGIEDELTLAGLGASPDQLLGNTDMFQKYLGGAPTTIEQMSGASVTVEESMSGFGGAPTTVEESVSGLGGFEGASAFV